MFRNENERNGCTSSWTHNLHDVQPLCVRNYDSWTDDEVIESKHLVFRPQASRCQDPPCLRMYARYSCWYRNVERSPVTKRGPCWRTAVGTRNLCFRKPKIVSELKHQPTRYQNKLSMNQIHHLSIDSLKNPCTCISLILYLTVEHVIFFRKSRHGFWTIGHGSSKLSNPGCSSPLWQL